MCLTWYHCANNVCDDICFVGIQPSKSSSKSFADRIVERSRRSVEVRKVTTTDRSKDARRKSAPMSHR